MKLYHGSPNNFSTVRKNQAQQGDDMDVPKDELLDAIYLSPKFEFALAVASMPEGAAHIDGEKHTIEFENPQLFDLEKVVYMYEFDSEAIPLENLKYVDEQQYAVINTPELRPNRVTTHKAEEIMRFYELKNWERNEAKLETRFKK